MSKSFKWAKNPLKLQRAIAESRSSDEAEIKKVYIKFGGLLNDVEDTPAEEVEETTTEAAVETTPEVDNEVDNTVSEEVAVEEKPKAKRAPRTKKNA